MANAEPKKKSPEQPEAAALDEVAQKAGEHAHGLLAELQPALDALTERLHTLAEQSRELAASAGHHTRDGVVQARDSAGDYVAEKPFQSLAVATAAGLVLGWLISRR